MPPENDRARPGEGTGPAVGYHDDSANVAQVGALDPEAPPCPPILDAYRSEDGDHLLVWCTHELRWHRHGSGCRCDDVCSCRVGGGDGHRGAHCSCAKSPYRDNGYVLKEVGTLTADVVRRHGAELTSYIRGCRWSSCRLDRAARLLADQHPSELPAPSDPLAVARQIVRGYCDVDRSADEDNPGGPLMLDYQIPDAHLIEHDPGPQVLRRWRGSWMRWRESHWAEVEDEDITAQLYERMESATYVKATKAGVPVLEPWRPNRRSVGEVLAALGGITLLPSDVDAPSWLRPRFTLDGSPIHDSAIVSCRNGLLDTDSRELQEHDPDWFNLVAVPFDYEVATPRPARWLQFLDGLWPDDPESVAALQEWFGYVLSGRTDLQKILLIVGPPRSGKGTIARILQELVGRGHCTGPTLASLSTNFGLQPLVGKPLAVVADARLGGRDTHVVVERLLSISGEDSLTIDRKYRGAWTGRLPTRLMVLSNELPNFGDASGAIATRFVALTLTRSWLGQEDIGLERALAAELPGILNWALDGLDRLNEHRRFTEPRSSGEALVAMTDAASPMSAFVRERCDVAAGEQVPVAELFAAWRGWCLDNGRDHPGNQQTFGRNLRAVLPAVRLHRPRDLVTGHQVRTYDGIGLRRGETRLIPLSVQSHQTYFQGMPHDSR